MPHAVLLRATRPPVLGEAPFARDGAVLHKVLEVAESANGWLLKSLIVRPAGPLRFLTRIDRRDDGLVVRLDDHMPVERTPEVFDHLARLAALTIEANPGAELGPTNLADRIRAFSGSVSISSS